MIGPYGWLGTVPSLMALIQHLSDHGREIDILLTRDNTFPQPIFENKTVQTFFLPETNSNKETIRRLRFFSRWIPYVLSLCKRREYQCFIGVDPWGLILSAAAAALTGVPFVYLSLEIYVGRRLSSNYLKVMKVFERSANGKAAFTIIQDWDRAGLLMAENHLAKERVRLLPNAPTGSAGCGRTTFLRSTLGIDSDMPILLSLGSSMHRSSKSLELARMVSEGKAKTILVFHARRRVNGDYPAEVNKYIDNKHVYLSSEPLDIRQVRQITAGAEIGIALYDTSPDEKNVYTMSHSSGKIAHYLQCGLPVITSDLPSVRQYIEGYKCGICVGRVEEVGRALEDIIADYRVYSDNAIRCFQDEFDLGPHLAQITEELGSLSDR